jgi:tRNA (mo5U34)-methyltransferase
MAFRLMKVAGVELSVNLDEEVQRTKFWEYILRPTVYGAVRAGAAVSGGLSRLGKSLDGPAKPAQRALQPEQEQIDSRIRGVTWYHTIDLGDGIVTPGVFNYMPLVSLCPFPEDMSGMRALDIATYDGFWAFEMERRGAEVVGTDVGRVGDLDIPPPARARMTPEELDAPTGQAFRLAHEIRKSRVRREICNVYDLSPERMGGKFDVVFCGHLLTDVQNPFRALERVRSVVGGYAILLDCFNPFVPHLHMLYKATAQDRTWWAFSFTAMERMISDAGFSKVEVLHKIRCGSNIQPAPTHRAVFRLWP